MSWLLPVVGFAAHALTSFFHRPKQESPSLAHIEARWAAERAKSDAENAAKLSQQHTAYLERQAELERELASVRQQNAEMAAARANEETERMKKAMEEAAAAARRAVELSNEATRAAKEDAERLRQEAQAERERSQKMREDAEKKMAEVKDEAARAQKAADDATADKDRAEDAARSAAAETKKAMDAKEDAERRLKEGIQPVVTPTPEEVAAAKRRVQYRKDCFHFAVAGISGSGKSSLVNAFRGLRSKDVGAAAVGITETTLQMTRYADANPENPFVWYDIPGAGTIKCRDWQYFNDQGLYVFDCIIVLCDNRFTMTDVAILMNARRFKIPTYIVRSKADQHIRNLMDEMRNGSDAEDEGPEHLEMLHNVARKQFIEKTRKSVKTNLEDANLPDQRVYIVSNKTLLSVVQNKMPKKMIDEAELFYDLMNEAQRRRNATGDGTTGRDSGRGGQVSEMA